LSFNIDQIRADFPALHQQIYNRPLVYFDNAATTLKPQVVIDTLSTYYSTINSNVHRGVHYLSQQSTEAFENARNTIKDFINANHSHEIILTKGTTESINLVANSFGENFIHEGDEIIVSAVEHHANIVPWQMICKAKKAMLKIIPVDDQGNFLIEEFKNLISEKTKIISVAHISNSLGIINPVKEIIDIAHSFDIPVLIDGAQGIVHSKVDVLELDCDFYAFSSHKLYGPMGVGILYGKEKWLLEMPPYQTGGEMIKTVTFEETTFNDLPFKFETGTPNVADVLGFEAALMYILQIGHDEIFKHEKTLMKYALQKFKELDDVKIYGNISNNAGVISFLLNNIHPYDAGTIIDKLGIAVRTGNHCAQPIMDRFGIHGTIRASFAMYNTTQEIDKLIEALLKVKEMFS
jgi:cysteine desulfurase/selenocysteine lyase